MGNQIRGLLMESGIIIPKGISFIRNQIPLVQHDDRRNNWIKELGQRRGKNISAVAVANKNAGIARAVLTKKEPYKTVA